MKQMIFITLQYMMVILIYIKENTTLGDLNLTGLTHTKDVATVVNTFTATTLPYKYILADYNGQATYTSTSGGTSATTINVDYLVPSVKVSYLWDNLFSTYGFTYSGSIFSSPDFTNLYLTYPKVHQQLVVL
jgi:hypothetical protein